MPVDPTLSGYSDLLFQGTVVVYLLAMAMYAVEYVSVRARAATPAVSGSAAPAAGSAGTGTAATADEPGKAQESTDAAATATLTATPPGGTEAVADRVLADARGEGGDAARGSAGTGDDGARAGRSRADRFGRMAVSLSILGVLLHLGSIVLRGLATARWPLGNMYEFVSAICLAAVVSWLLVLQRSSVRRKSATGGERLRRLGVFVLAPVLVLMFLGGTVLYAQAAPVVPALHSYWLVIHVTTVTAASGLLVVPGVASILYLMRRAGKPAGFTAKLPDAAALDRLAYRTTVVAFPIYTFAVIAGAIWAEAAWGRFWGWDPKETVAFVAWVVYAAYLHARATAGWRTTGAAYINIVGLATILFNLFFINMVVAGLHSYAGL